LVASRSDAHASDDPLPEKEGKHRVRAALEREDNGAEVTVHLKVGYKTILLAVVLFDVVHLSVRELIDADWMSNIIPF
jgi:hypothetical protein